MILWSDIKNLFVIFCRKNRKVLISVIAAFSFLFLTGFVKDVADIFAGLSLLTDSVSDINDAIVEEELIQNQVNAVNNQQREMEDSLREIDYTEAEVHEILGTDPTTGDSNTLLVLRRAAKNVKRAKDLIKRLSMGGQINPDVTTAGYSAISAKSLSDIKILLSQVIYNQNRDYQDRIIERARDKHDWSKAQKMIHAVKVNVTSGKNETESFKSLWTQRTNSLSPVKNSDHSDSSKSNYFSKSPLGGMGRTLNK